MRLVLVGRGLLPGRTMDDAIDAVCSTVASADPVEVSIAVLDQAAASQGLAVGWSDESRDGSTEVMDLVAAVLRESFASVRVGEGDARGLVDSIEST